MAATEIVSHIYIKVDGAQLAEKVQNTLLEAIVDQHVHLPGMFSLRFYDPSLERIEQGPFQLQSKVEISGKTPDDKEVILIKGEVTALEPHFGEGMIAELVVRGYDQSHRLYRAIKSKTYLNIKDSDLASEIAAHAQLKADVEPTQTVYDHLYQHNQSDLVFLMQRAWRIGYECFVEDGKLIFRKPASKEPTIKLSWGEHLLSFSPRMRMSEQVEEVIIKGWDVQQKAAIIGRANKGSLYPKAGEKEQETEKEGKKFSRDGKLIIVDQAVASQAEADILAAARFNELTGAFVEADGVAFRRPDVRAGQVIKLEALGKRFSGNYLVTSATHIYTNEGFKTTFNVSGLRNGLLLSQLTQSHGVDRWPGVVPAIVTNTDDPKKWGRIKVKYPWMSEEDESDWLRLASAGAGVNAGFCTLPAVNDEMLVTFLHGNFDQPVAIGGVWNGKDAPPEEVNAAAQGERPKVRTWRSRKGHRLTTYDDAKNKIELVTAGEHKMVWDDANKKIEVTSKGGHQISIDDKGKKIEIKSNSGLSITMDDNGKEIKINSDGKVTVSGSQGIKIESSANVQLQAGANLELQASGQVSIKGAMIQLN